MLEYRNGIHLLFLYTFCLYMQAMYNVNIHERNMIKNDIVLGCFNYSQGYYLSECIVQASKEVPNGTYTSDSVSLCDFAKLATHNNYLADWSVGKVTYASD